MSLPKYISRVYFGNYYTEVMDKINVDDDVAGYNLIQLVDEKQFAGSKSWRATFILQEG